jgi:lipopolysaccharide biosynthesis glycosyltransferase
LEKESRDTDSFAAVCAAEGIQFSCINPEVTDHSHVAFSRLFLDSFVPKHYSQLLYIDGDTQINGSLDSLIMADVPPRHFLAATDPIAFQYSQVGQAPQKLRAYLKRLGLSSIKHYFNSGVLRINRSGWSQIASQAYAFCSATDKRQLHFWDQDGLNAVAATSDVRLPMSLKYNFPIFLRNCRVEQQLKPVIYHFMSNPKPWNGTFPPWNQSATLPYRELCRRYPAMGRYQPPFSPWQRARYMIQQRAKQLDESISWGLSWRRGEVLLYEDRCRNFSIRSGYTWS